MKESYWRTWYSLGRNPMASKVYHCSRNKMYISYNKHDSPQSPMRRTEDPFPRSYPNTATSKYACDKARYAPLSNKRNHETISASQCFPASSILSLNISGLGLKILLTTTARTPPNPTILTKPFATSSTITSSTLCTSSLSIGLLKLA